MIDEHTIPEISVLMCVYKPKSDHLKEAIESILNQTYDKFEFIIIVDGPDSEVEKIISDYNDPRIKMSINQHNLGLTYSLNVGLDIAIGKYIARMDSDDIAAETRLEEQYKFMEKEKQVIVLGSYANILGTNDRVVIRHCNDQDILKIRLMFYNAGIIHPTAFIRRSVLIENNIKYDVSIKKSQDYELWTRLVKLGHIKVIPKVLLKYRIHTGQVTNNKSDISLYTNIIRERQWSEVGLRFTQNEMDLLNSITSKDISGTKSEFNKLFDKINNWNKEKQLFNNEYFRNEVNRLWLHLGLKKLKNDKNSDMIISKRTLSVINYRTLKYISNYYFKENK